MFSRDTSDSKDAIKLGEILSLKDSKKIADELNKKENSSVKILFIKMMLKRKECEEK